MFGNLGADQLNDDVFESKRGRVASEIIYTVFSEDEDEDDQSTYLSGGEDEAQNECEEEEGQSDHENSQGSWCSQASPMPTPMPAPMPKPDICSHEQVPQMWLQLKNRNSSDGHYLTKTMAILPAIVDQNPFYKQHVGKCIFPFVQAMLCLDSRAAPKVTGMLIELPIDEIRAFMQNYETLSKLVDQAMDML